MFNDCRTLARALGFSSNFNFAGQATRLLLLLFGPLRALKDATKSIWAFPSNYRAQRLWLDGLDQQIKEHRKRKDITYQ